MQSLDHAPALRVALLSDRWLEPAEWSRRGMAPTHLQPVAFERLLTDPPAAIVLDPECTEARQLTDCWQLHDLLRVPVIVLAPGASGAEVAALLERGAEDVVTGTPDAALLAATVAAILRRVRRQAPQQVPPVVRLGSAEVDLVRRVIRRPGGTQSLSRTEFGLLLALLRAGGRACTHHDLITRVWGADYASATHYLRLYIRYLREKLEDDPRRPRFILNVWGTGYRLALAPIAEAAPVAESVPTESHASIASRESTWLAPSSWSPPAQAIRRTQRDFATTASR